MAKKSAKNKKALRRKQEAIKRSRVIRQDYTVGGRVKAFNGLPDGVQEAIDAARKAEEEARRKATQQVRRREDPTPSPQPMRNAQSAIPVVPKEITPVTVKETPQIMGKPTTPQEPTPPRVPREVTPVIVEEPPRIMDKPTTPTKPLFPEPVIIPDPIGEFTSEDVPTPEVRPEVAPTDTGEKFTPPETIRLPDGTILNLGTGETTDIPTATPTTTTATPTTTTATPTTTTATPTVTTNVTATAEDEDPAAVGGAYPNPENNVVAQVITRGLDGIDYPNPVAAYDANVTFLASQQTGGGEDPDDYGSRYDGKQYSAGDYAVISESGGDKNSDNFITEEEWATWMLNKGPTPGFEEGWTKKLKEVAEQGDLRPSTAKAIYERLGIDRPLVDFSGPYPAPRLTRKDFSNATSYSDYSATYTRLVNSWNAQSPLKRSQNFAFLGPADKTKLKITLEGRGVVGDPAEDVLKRIKDDLPRVDAPEAIDTVKTDLDTDGSTLTSDSQIKKISAPVDVGTRTISAGNIIGTTGEVSQAKAVPIDTISKFDADKSRTGETPFATSEFEREAEASKGDLSERASPAEIDTLREELSKGKKVIFRGEPVVVDPITGNPVVMSPVTAAEKQRREAILDETPAEGDEAIIINNLGYEASQRRELTGEAAKGDAVSFIEDISSRGDVSAIPSSIVGTLLDNPAQVTAQMDQNPVEVQAAIAALPEEALVSAQLENLLAGIDEGVTPAWARPAVQLVESRMSARGLSVSTVGRDALFNAIIQTALPIAQSNATALQQRATQNLSNEQQANLQQASQDMQLRLTNLGNRQSAGSQTAQLAQQINLAQGEISKQTVLTEAQQIQQVRLQSLQNEQQAAITNLGNDQQIEVANLQVEATRLGANQSAVNQERLAEMQVAANFLQKNGEFAQQMEVANLSNDQQMRLAFLTSKNQAESQNLTSAQQTELANLNSRLELNKTNSNLAQQMGLAQLNVDQQQAMQNASVVANMDLSEFNSEQQMEIANSKFMQTISLQDFSQRQQSTLQNATTLASMDLQVADSLTKVSIENARNFLQVDMANLNTEQQAYILDSQQSQQVMLSNTAAQNASKQFNATSDNQRDQFMTSLGSQLEQFNSSQSNAMSQFNATEANRLSAIAAGNTLDASKAEASLNSQVDQFNTQMDLQRDQWNAQNEQAVIQSNINWRRQLNLSETAAENAANQQVANQTFQLSAAEQSFVWQTLRDEATYLRQQYESEETRKTNLYATALSNESDKAVDAQNSAFNRIDSLIGISGANTNNRAGDNRALDVMTEEELRQLQDFMGQGF